MSILGAIFLVVSCALSGQLSPECSHPPSPPTSPTAGVAGPIRSSEALDVVLTAKAAVAWDVSSNTVLYAKNANARRPVASLAKLLSTLVVSGLLSPETIITIPPEASATQSLGAHIRLPVGEHASVDDLLAASLIPSANDAIVSLVYAAAADEGTFVVHANEEAKRLGLLNTKLANATGLPGGEQYSTANDIRKLLTLVYANPTLGPYLNDAKGSLVTTEGTKRQYTSTNDLLATYLPIVAAKTGYTREAGENVALLTQLPSEHIIGIIILGSGQRFQDAKIMAEWISRHYTWPK